MAVTIGTAIFEVVGFATAAEVTASTALTIGAALAGAATLAGAAVGLSYVAKSLQGGQTSSFAGSSGALDPRLFDGAG